MRRSNADTRARAALAVVLNGFVTRLVRRAPKLQKPPPQGPGEIPQWVLDATRRMMDAIKILDHKILPDGSEYALATVRLEEVKNAYRVALDPVDREPLLAAMESAFEESLAE